MRAALFGAPAEDDQTMGAIAETALYAQWFHDPQIIEHLYYARWKKGEIDIVSLDPKTQRPAWATEVKWSDRSASDPGELGNLSFFKKIHPSMTLCEITTRTYRGEGKLRDGTPVTFVPTSIAVYTVGKFLLHKKALVSEVASATK